MWFFPCTVPSSFWRIQLNLGLVYNCVFAWKQWNNWCVAPFFGVYVSDRSRLFTFHSISSCHPLVDFHNPHFPIFFQTFAAILCLTLTVWRKVRVGDEQVKEGGMKGCGKRRKGRVRLQTSLDEWSLTSVSALKNMWLQAEKTLNKWVLFVINNSPSLSFHNFKCPKNVTSAENVSTKDLCDSTGSYWPVSWERPSPHFNCSTLELI